MHFGIFLSSFETCKYSFDKINGLLGLMNEWDVLKDSTFTMYIKNNDHKQINHLFVDLLRLKENFPWKQVL